MPQAVRTSQRALRSSALQIEACLNSDALKSCLLHKSSPLSTSQRQSSFSTKYPLRLGALIASKTQVLPPHALSSDEKVGVLLLNLGGPETLEDVQPFLFNLFADPVSLLFF